VDEKMKRVVKKGDVYVGKDPGTSREFLRVTLDDGDPDPSQIGHARAQAYVRVPWDPSWWDRESFDTWELIAVSRTHDRFWNDAAEGALGKILVGTYWRSEGTFPEFGTMKLEEFLDGNVQLRSGNKSLKLKIDLFFRNWEMVEAPDRTSQRGVDGDDSDVIDMGDDPSEPEADRFRPFDVQITNEGSAGPVVTYADVRIGRYSVARSGPTPEMALGGALRDLADAIDFLPVSEADEDTTDRPPTAEELSRDDREALGNTLQLAVRQRLEKLKEIATTAEEYLGAALKELARPDREIRHVEMFVQLALQAIAGR
jgi:hypothetical protein